MDVLSFLKEKTSKFGWRGILHAELEGWILELVGWIPGALGFFLRYLALKCLMKNLGGSTWVQPRVRFVHTNKISAGKFLGINSGTYINAVGGITIGDFVVIGSNVTISSGKHPTDGRDVPVFARSTIPMPIVIEDDVWIGAGSVIVPGVTLRKGTVIGANSVVTKDTEPYSINVGAPAKLLKYRPE